MSKGKQYFIAMAIAAILSAISFFQINSYWADKHHFNGVFGWIGIGVALALIAGYFLWKVVKNTNN